MPYKKIIIKFLKLFNLLSNKTTRRGLFHNICSATIELEEFLVGLELDTVIDIGSNKGQFILLVEKCLIMLKYYLLNQLKKFI